MSNLPHEQNIDELRAAEFVKYDRAYSTGKYRMKNARFKDAVNDLKLLPNRGSFLDVSCGYGDVLGAAKKLGFSPCVGTEINKDRLDSKRRIVYAEAHSLPFVDKEFDVVTMFDVIEHLIPGDDKLACAELFRVARKHIIISANNKPSINHIGEDLHINKRPYDTWNSLFFEWFPNCKIYWFDERRNDKGKFASNTWRIDL